MHPCRCMSYVAHAMKLVQFFVLIKYCGAAFPHYFKPVNAVLPEAYNVQTYEFELNLMAVVDVLLVAAGQALNSGVYNSLGNTWHILRCTLWLQRSMGNWLPLQPRH